MSHVRLLGTSQEPVGWPANLKTSRVGSRRHQLILFVVDCLAVVPRQSKQTTDAPPRHLEGYFRQIAAGVGISVKEFRKPRHK